MNILVVLTSHDTLGESGEKTGFWLEEFVAPYYVLKDAGAELTLASPKGGQPPIDPKSNLPDFQTDATRRFEQDVLAQNHLANTFNLNSIYRLERFDAIFYPGGHGPLWDLTDNPDSIALIEAFIAADKPVASVCHAPAVLLNVKDAKENYLLENKKVTGFSNSEEEAVGLTQVVPFLLEDKLIERGALYAKGDDWTSFVIVDGNLITGQNPASSEATAEALLELLA